MIEIAEEALEAVEERNALSGAQDKVRDEIAEGSNHHSASTSKSRAPLDTRDDPHTGDSAVDDDKTPP